MNDVTILKKKYMDRALVGRKIFRFPPVSPGGCKGPPAKSVNGSGKTSPLEAEGNGHECLIPYSDFSGGGGA